MSATELHFRSPILAQVDGDTQVRLPIDDHPTVEFRIKGDPDRELTPTQLGNLCLTVGLIPAMRQGALLKIEAPVSAQLLSNSETLQHIYCRWWKAFSRIEVEAAKGSRDGESGTRGTAAFFSGGVDSLYTVFRERAQLSQLIFVHGFDIPHADAERANLVRARLGDAAEAIGLPMREVWTNIRDFSEPLKCYWGYHYFGAALAAVAHLFSGDCQRIFIPGSEPYEELFPWGGHVLTDGLWRSGDLELIHHGPEASRCQKLQAIGAWPVAQGHLRVCWEGESSEYNCGRCEKCTRTLAELRALGIEEAFAHLFDRPLDLKTVADYRAPTREFASMVMDCLEHAELNDAPDDLVAALRSSIDGIEADITIKRFANHNNDVLASAEWQRLLPKVRNKLFRSLSESDPAWFVERLNKILPEQREVVVDLLHDSDPKWLRRAVRKRRWGASAAKPRHDDQ